MGFYPDVTRGDKFRPITALENDVRHMVNAIDGFVTPGANNKRNHEVVAIINNTDTMFQAGTIVNLEKEGDDATGAIFAVPIQSVDEKWGIVTGNVAPKAFGSCIISGVVAVPNNGHTGADYLEPDLTDQEKRKFMASAKGGVRVLSHFRLNSRSLINLGEGRPSADEPEYDNYFKVIPGTEENGVLKTIKIVDGSYLNNPSYAGVTDIGSVAPGELVIPSSSIYNVYLILKWDGTAYTQFFSLDSFGGSSDSVFWHLAEGQGNTIIQRWTGGQIYWGSRYFV